MGKLGGRELNYASDVDVLFVHDGDADAAERTARALLATMTTRADDGIVFRTDADLRPEGRSGALTRSLDATPPTGTSWAQTWEFQALIKARPVAGDAALGDRFMDGGEPFVWPERARPRRGPRDPCDEGARRGDHRRRGLDDRELKRGRGGIRDIEFAVQLLQLVHGRHDAFDPLADHARRARRARRRRLRRPTPTPSGSTARTGSCAPSSTGCSSGTSSRRTAPVRRARADPARTRARVPRRAGAHSRGSSSTPSTASHQRAVRGIHEKLFFAPLLETLAGPGPLTPEAAEERLAAFGFLDLERTRAAARELTDGLTRSSRLMQQLLPVLLEWCSESPDPDLGLLQLRRLAEGPAPSATLAMTFRDTPGAAERTCRILGSSRMLGDALRRQPEFVDTLGDDDVLAARRRRGRARRRGDRHARVARRRRATARGAAPLQAPRAAAHRHARPPRFARPRRDRARAHRARGGVPRGRARVAPARRCRSR